MTTKKAPCKNCCPTAPVAYASYSYLGGDTLVPTWECDNCGWEAPRRVCTKRPGLNRSQLRAIWGTVKDCLFGEVFVECLTDDGEWHYLGETDLSDKVIDAVIVRRTDLFTHDSWTIGPRGKVTATR